MPSGSPRTKEQQGTSKGRNGAPIIATPNTPQKPKDLINLLAFFRSTGTRFATPKGVTIHSTTSSKTL